MSILFKPEISCRPLDVVRMNKLILDILIGKWINRMTHSGGARIQIDYFNGTLLGELALHDENDLSKWSFNDFNGHRIFGISRNQCAYIQLIDEKIRQFLN